AAVAGAGFDNAAVLTPTDEEGGFEVIAHRGQIGGPAPRFSRTLIRQAAEGTPARLTGGNSMSEAMSIMELNIDEALCVPIMMGSSVAAFLYLDNREGQHSSRRRTEDSRSFTVGLARLAGMALTNLMQREVEQRYARLEAELSAGAEAQRWVMPQSAGTFGPLSYVGVSRPGRVVGGDFFDVISLGDSKVAAALGDVSGKGIPASVLMTAAAGYLHAALERHGDPGRAVTDLNRFVNPRRPGSKFLTLWVGVFDLEAGTLHYIDAGHGHAVFASSSGEVSTLTHGTSCIVGIDTAMRYESIVQPLSPGGCALIVSDGLVEQPGGPAGRDMRNQFGIERVKSWLADARADSGAADDALA
ncbi:MAG: SpoIIE family protein phosphatase, partial [Planctomycetota bacterium]|nr:SpoIIE family protein phosphatase [Planctomycetota bacterium]